MRLQYSSLSKEDREAFLASIGEPTSNDSYDLCDGRGLDVSFVNDDDRKRREMKHSCSFESASDERYLEALLAL